MVLIQSNLFTVFAIINGHMLSDYWENWVRHRFIMLIGAAGNLKEPEPNLSISIQIRQILNIPISKANIKKVDHVLTNIFLRGKFQNKIMFNTTYQSNLANKNIAVGLIFSVLQLSFAQLPHYYNHISIKLNVSLCHLSA